MGENEAYASIVYQYNKYTSAQYYEMGPWQYVGEGYNGSGYTSFTFDSNTGLFSNAGDYQDFWGYYTNHFRAYDNMLENYYVSTKSVRFSVLKYKQGNFIASLQASPGTYPDNGRHSDGYWYVMISTVPEVSISTPSQNSTLFLNTNISKRSA